MCIRDSLEYVPDDDRCQAQGRFVQQEQPGARHERPPDGEHLLLPPRKGPGVLVLSLLQPGEEREEMCIRDSVCTTGATLRVAAGAGMTAGSRVEGAVVWALAGTS